MASIIQTRRTCALGGIICVILLELIVRSGATEHQATIMDAAENVTLECVYKKPTLDYTRVTIDWRKVNTRDSLLSVTLVTMVDFVVEGVVDERYGATSEGWLTINGPLTSDDEGKYACVVVFRLAQPIGDSGYLTEHDATYLNIVERLQLYAKDFGQTSTSASTVSIQNKPSKFVCNASDVDPNTNILWSLVNGNDVEDVPDYMIIDSEEVEGDGRMRRVSELTLLPPLELTETLVLSISCSNVEGETGVIDTASLIVKIRPRREGNKKKGKGGKSRRGNRRERQRQC